MLIGLQLLAIIAIMGGIIAYIGDKIGSKVGKRRMSLFGLRPKYTSIVVTIITGLIIAATTVGVLTITSRSVRTALFGLDQMYAEMDSLNQQISAKNTELQSVQAELDSRKEEIDRLSQAQIATQAELEQVRAMRDQMGDDLVSTQEAYERSRARLADVEKARQVMEDHISDLQSTTKYLESNITNLREGTVLFQVGEVLSSAVVRPGLSQEEAELAVSNIINDTNGLVLRKLHSDDSGTALYVSRDNVSEVSQALANSKEAMVLRVVAAGNIIVGEPAVAEILIYPQHLIFHKNEVILAASIEGGPNAQHNVLEFLQAVNAKGREQGVIPDSLSGDVGTVAGDELFKVISRLYNVKGPIQIEASAAEDVYSAGPMQIHLRLVSVDDVSIQ